MNHLSECKKVLLLAGLSLLSGFLCHANGNMDSIPPDSILRVGMPAPRLWVAKWHGGKPVEKLEKGRFYIIEFSSILCGPCKAANPRLERLHKKYRNIATVIGVYGDREQDVRWVDSLIKKLKLTYSIASADPVPYPNSKTWLKGDPKTESNLSGGDFRGYCTTFLVDRSGTVVWMGNALAEPFERTIDAYIKGGNGQSIYSSYMDERNEFIKKFAAVDNAIKTHPENVAPMLHALDSMITKHPDEELYITFKLMLLSKTDETAYYNYLRTLANTKFKKNGSDFLNLTLTYAVQELANQYSPLEVFVGMRHLKSTNYELLIELARHLNAINSGRYSALYLSWEALGYYLKGDKEKSVEIQEQVIELNRQSQNSTEHNEKLLEIYKRGK